MSITRKRAGRKSYGTFRQNVAVINAAAVQIGENVRAEIALHGGIVERTVLRTPHASYARTLNNAADSVPMEIPFYRADIECERSFSVLGELGAAAAFGLILDSGATVHTRLATYRLASRTVRPPKFQTTFANDC